MRRPLVQAAVLGVVVVVTAAATLWITDRDPAGRAGGEAVVDTVVDSGDIVLASVLQPFDDCGALLDHFVEHALEEVGPYGLASGGPIMYDDAAMAAEASVGGARAAADAGTDSAAAGGQQVDAASGTNVQEAGVDEADIVKSDERVLVAVSQEAGRLQLVDLTGDAPRLAGSVDLPDSWQQEMFLAGDRVLVISGATDVPFATRDVAAMGIAPYHSATSSLILIDVSDVDAPRTLSTLTLDGTHVSARLVDGVARLVLRSGPVGLGFVMPEGSGLNAERRAEEANRRIVADSTIDNWLPAYVRQDAAGTVVDEGRLLDCANVHRPDGYAGLGLTTVLSVDIAADFIPRGGTAVVTGGDMVYASVDSLYVATQSWEHLSGRGFGPVDTNTSIHRFSLDDAAQAQYTGSGAVEGRLLNQWAMSEHEGHLRVATTTGAGESSQSSVVVLSTDGGELAEVGRVAGLGLTEQIYAVRYMGERGYVVTFRETDPLYVLDLSDPAHPRVEGELKIPGFSSYLHPVGDGRLIGVGQDATLDGRTTGLQVSLFDVRNASSPQRVDSIDLGPGYSPVQTDHRAFLYWDPQRLAVLPMERFDMPVPIDPIPGAQTPAPVPEPRTVTPFAGAVAVRVEGDQLVAVAELSHDDGTGGASGVWNPIQRAHVVGGQLLTVGPGGIGYGPITDLGQRGFLAFR